MRHPVVVVAALLAGALVGGALPEPGTSSATRPPPPADATREVFVVSSGRDTLAIERFSRTESRLQGELVELASFNVRESYVAFLAPDASVVQFEVSVRPGNTARDTPPVRRSVVTFHGDSAFAVVRGDGFRSTRRLGTGTGALPFLKLSAALMEQAALRARALGGERAEVPFLDVEGGRAFTARVSWSPPDSARIELDGLEVHALVDSSGRILSARVPRTGLTIERIGDDRAPSIGASDYSAPAGAPYTAEDVVLRSSSRHLLAGTLTRPRDGARVPAVVLISGSGPQDRDASFLGTYRPFRQIADTLSRSGIAVLRMDDRGVGASLGSFSAATSADFAEDVRAALSYLRSRPDIEGDRLALLGESEGGLVASMVAATDEGLRGIVLMGTPSRNGRSVIASQVRYHLDRGGVLSRTQRDSVLGAVAAKNDTLAHFLPWLRFILDYDPLPTARHVATPVLILQGGSDRQVTSNQAQELAVAFRTGGNHDVRVRVFPHLNHLFLNDADGNPEGYAALPSKALPPDILGEIAEWLAERLHG